MEPGLADVTTSASFSYTAGVLRTRRVVPARFRYTAGSFLTGTESEATGTTVVPKLNRLTAADRIPGEDEKSFMRRVAIWQKTMTAIEDAFTAINARVDEVAILARLSAVEAKAEVANDNAVAAQTVAQAAAVATEQTFQQVDPVYADAYRTYYDY